MTAPDQSAAQQEVAAAVKRLRDAPVGGMGGYVAVARTDLALVLDDHARLTAGPVTVLPYGPGQALHATASANAAAPPVVGEALGEAEAAAVEVLESDESEGMTTYDLGCEIASAVLAALPNPVAVVEGVDLAGVLAGHWRVSRTGRCGGDSCVTDLTRRSVQEHDQHQAGAVRAAVVAALNNDEETAT